ncbi:hypothetical protein Lal_00040547 [Lupinus albus]|nr:hypothetical protein Lal_00040547 [Lupinus albus]
MGFYSEDTNTIISGLTIGQAIYEVALIIALLRWILCLIFKVMRDRNIDSLHTTTETEPSCMSSHVIRDNTLLLTTFGEIVEKLSEETQDTTTCAVCLNQLNMEDEMAIVRDIVSDFSLEDEIELCGDDNEEDADVEIGSSELHGNITYATPSSFFTYTNFSDDRDYRPRSTTFTNDNDLSIGMQFESKESTLNAIKQFHIRNSFHYVAVESKPNKYAGRCKHYGADIGVVEINKHLLTAMVERWRSETHTFHLPNGECTITLQDVAYQLGLPIDGKPITGDTSLDWVDLCVRLLGVAPTDRQIMGQRVQHTWLESIYQELPEDADEEVVEQHARAFILRMIGGFLMPDTSGVMRQFGLQQTIPQDPSNFDKLHKMDLRGKNEYNWPKKHEYMQWYLQRTRRYISLDRTYSVGAFKFASELMERTAGPQCYNNPIQTIDYVYQACKELVKALAELNPMAFSISQPQAPPSQNFAMPTYDSELQHQSSSQTHFQPQMLSPHVYGEQPYGSFTAYPTNYHMGQSSQYQGSLPSMFATNPNTSMSAYGTQDFYRPTMPSQIQQCNIYGNENNEDDDDEEEEHQLQTRGSGRVVEIPQQQLRVLPPRRRRSPHCVLLHIIDVIDNLRIVCI